MAVFITITAIAATVRWDVDHAGWLGSEVVPTTVLTYLTANIVPIHRLVLEYKHLKPHIHTTQIVALVITSRITHQASVGNALLGVGLHPLSLGEIT